MADNMQAGARADQTEIDRRAILGTLDDEMVFSCLPAVPSQRDVDFMDTLSPEERQQVLRRLYAILRSEQGLPVVEASKFAGVTVPNLYRLRRLWADPDRSGMTFLAGYRARSTRKVGSSDRVGQASAKIAGLIESRDVVDLSVKEISQLVQRTQSARYATHTLDVVSREIRQKARNTPEALQRKYGSRILVDYSAVSLVLFDTETGESSLVEIAWVIEEASQLILAAEPAIDKGRCETQVFAMKTARRFLEWHRLDVTTAKPTSIEAIVPEPSSVQDQNYIGTLTANLGEGGVTAIGARRFGRFVADVIGFVLGRIKIIPRATLAEETSAANVRAFGRDALDRRAAYALVAQAVADHNAPIIDGLRKSGLSFCRAEDPAGNMASALTAALG